MNASAARYLLLGLAIVVVVSAVVGGLVVLGPPSEERLRRLDERRVQNLRAIASAVDSHWNDGHRRLPSSLEELGRDRDSIRYRDPVNAEPYGYRVVDGKTYELCAAFDRDSRGSSSPDETEGFWSHGSGHRCFRMKVRER